MIRKPDSTHNLHTVYVTFQPRRMECMQCQHRAALAHDKIGAHSGIMKEVRQLNFKCPACGSVSNTLYMFHSQGEVDAFLAGKAEW